MIDFGAPTNANGRASESALPRYRILGPPEIWAPIPPTTYSIATIAAGDVAMLNAHGSSFKSWMAIAAVIAKAAGAPWLEHFPCEPAPALYLGNEMGPDEERRRMQRCARAMGHAGPVNDVSLVSLPGFTLSSPAGLAEVRKLAQGHGLIAVDSLAAFCPDVDENDARFADPLKALKQIGEETRCAFLLLHHSRKSRGDGEDQRERPRGTSALFAACDVVMQLTRHGEGFLSTQTKARRGKAATPFAVYVEDVSGQEATRVFARDADEAKDDAATKQATTSLDRAKRAILLLLAKEHDLRSGNDIFRRAKGRRDTCFDAIAELEERGLIALHDGFYRLASEVRQ